VNELGFWSKVRALFNAHPYALLKKLPAEGFGGKGTPDGLYVVDGGVTGLLEFKYEPAWPVRADTLVKVGLTTQQRAWLEEWCAKSGRGHVLLGVAKDWFLLELHEVPPAVGDAEPRISRVALDGIRRQYRGGTFKDLARLPELLANLPAPVVDS